MIRPIDREFATSERMDDGPSKCMHCYSWFFICFIVGQSSGRAFCTTTSMSSFNLAIGFCASKRVLQQFSFLQISRALSLACFSFVWCQIPKSFGHSCLFLSTYLHSSPVRHSSPFLSISLDLTHVDLRLLLGLSVGGYRWV